MKKFLKNASIYLLLMIFAAAVIFSLNYFYGDRISQDIEKEIAEAAVENNYQLRYIQINANPLLQRITVENLNLLKSDEFNLIVNQAEISFTWQQILNYIRNKNFQLDKDFESQLLQLNYSNLQENYQLNFKNADLFYQGDFQLDELGNLKALLENSHQLDLSSDELKYDFPYYRSYGLNRENWNRLSTFNNFVLKSSYDHMNKKLIVEEFNLKGELLTVLFDFQSVIEYQEEEEKIRFNELKGEYDFLLTTEDLKFEENTFFENLSFKQLDSNGDLDLIRKENEITANSLNFNLNLLNFNLILSEDMSNQLNQNSFGILAQDNNFELTVDSLSYQQNYNFPNGESNSELKSSIVEAQLTAEYNLSKETPYLSNAKLTYKPKTEKAEQLNSFLQLVIGQRFKKNEEGYFTVEAWGDIDDLNYE